jgi:hypothetical protein
VVNNFTEDNGVAAGDVVAEYSTSDEDGDTVTVTLSDTTNYALDNNGNVVLTEAGAALVNRGQELPPFTLTPNDGTVNGEPVSADPSVTPVDDPSNLVKDIVETREDEPVSGNVLANDNDEDSVLTVTNFSVGNLSVVAGESLVIANVGQITIESDGSFTFEPNSDWNGQVPDIVYTTNTGQNQTLEITVNPVNDAPIAMDDDLLVNQGEALQLDLTKNDFDIDGDALSIVSIDDVVLTGSTQVITLSDGSGLVNVSDDGTIEFTPTIGYEGDANFSYVVTDGQAQSSANVTIEVNTVVAADDGNDESIYQATADFTNGVTIPVGSDGEPLFTIEALTINSNGNLVTGTISELNGYGIGVAGSIRDSGQVPDQIEFNPDSGQSEQLKFEFKELVNQVEFGAERLFGEENGGEQGAWFAYYNGELVSSGSFETVPGETSGTFIIDTGDIVFDTLVFAANENNVETGDSSDYVISTIDVTGVDLGDGAIIASEDSGVTVSDPANGLLANDVDNQGDSFELTDINGQSVSNGDFITLASGALLTIYADGTYSYDSNGAFEHLAAGERFEDSFTYTITDEHGATDTATAVVNVIGSNDAPEASTDTVSAIEGEVTVITTDYLISNDSDAEGDALQVIAVSSDPTGTNTISLDSEGATLATDKGVITVNSDGNIEYQTPTGFDHATTPTPTDTLYYLVSDGKGNSTWTPIEVSITDSDPVAIDDTDSVGFGGIGYGNVIAGENDGSGKDEIGADSTQLSSVSFEGQTYDQWDINDQITIDTGTATAIFNRDGSYSYDSNQAEGAVESFDTAALLNAQGVNLYAYSDYRDVVPANYNSNSANIVQLGNDVGIYYDNNDGNGSQVRFDEALVAEFQGDVTTATLTLSGVTSSETVYWQAFDDLGNEVASGTTNSNDLTIASNQPFNSVMLYTGTTNNFMLDSIDVQYSIGETIEDKFEYVITDSDGSQSSAELTVTQDSIPEAKDNVASAYEAGLSTGTDAGSGSNFVSGNLLDNDAGVSDSTSIADVAGQTPTNGIITIDTAYGSLTVYVDDSNGRRAGDFDYELTTTTIGDNVTDNFTYTIENAAGATASAELEVAIIDDVPIVNDIERNLMTTADPITTNISLVLDLSGSMDYSAGNGKTYLETAIESLRALVNEVDDTGDVNVQIVTFSGSTIENSGWLVDDVESTINYLESLVANGGTQYSEALSEVMASGPLPPADQSFVYFISDGVPNSGYEVDETLQSEWETYLDTSDFDISFAIGIGNAPLDELTPIAHSVDPNDNDSDYAVIVDDADDLTDTVLEYFDNGTITGQVKLLDTEGGILGGADGVSITSVIIDGITYQYNSATPEITVLTEMGGEFRINFDSGEYYYGIEVDRNVLNEQESIEINIEDGDGDQDSLDLILNIDYYASIDANVTNIITNAPEGNGLTIDADFLTHGDSVTSDTVISSVTSDDATVSINGGEVIIENSETGDSFEYEISGNGATDSAKVGIEYQDSNLLDGTNANDIIIAQSSAVSTTPVTINATVRSGSTFSTQSQYGFTFATIAAGLSVSKLTIDLSSKDDNANWDVSDGFQFNFSNSVGIDQTANIWDEMNVDSSTLTANFVDGDFSDGDEFWFSFDTDNLGSDQGSNFDGVSFSLTLSDGSTVEGTFVSDGNGGATAVVTRGIYDNVLDGADGDDVLVSADGDDLLLGGDGDDLLIGGQGNDILTGGEGYDLFAWQEGDLDGSIDTITDFDLALEAQGDYQGEKLDLSDLFQDVESDDVSALLDTIAQTISSTDNGSAITVEKFGDSVTIEFDGVSTTDLTNNLSNMLIIKDDL